MYSRIISQILRGSWAIDKRYAVAHGYLIYGLLNGMAFENDAEAKEAEESIPYILSAGSGEKKYVSSYDDAPEGSTAVIPIAGPLMKADQDDCGVINAGMASLGQRIKAADAHDNVSSIMFIVDSPGGTVDGTQELADIVKNTNKPTLAYVDGLAASAAYWIASAADEVIANNATAEIGSVGVRVSFMDIAPAWEKEGVKFHDVVSDQNPNKGKDFRELKNENYKPIKENALNPLADIFMNNIKENRPDIKEEALKGDVFLAEKAKDLGLIDSIGNFDVAVESLQSKVQDPKSSNINVKQKNIVMKEFKMIASLLGIASNFEATDEGIHLSVENMEAIENALSEKANAGKTHKDALDAAVQTATDAASAEVTAIDAALDVIDETIAAAEGTTKKVETVAGIVSALREGPAAETAEVSTSSDKGQGEGGSKPVVKEEASFMENLSAVESEYLK